MVDVYVKAVPFDKHVVTLALESGVDGLFVEGDRKAEVLSLGRTSVVTPEELLEVSLTDKADEEEAATALRAGGSVVLQRGWEIIPVENLLAQGGHLGVEVHNLEEARLAAGILERGVAFVVIPSEASEAIKPIVDGLKRSQGQMELQTARISAISQVGLGHRVCVDTCSLLHTGQGLLVGNSAAMTFLVNAETESNPYVAARPFRINAGGVHAYVSLPGDSTAYLEELRAGSEVLVVGHDGGTQVATVGRVKTEVRPLLLITAETQGRSGQVFLQNAETIRLVRPDGTPVSVVNLREGDEILCRTDTAGRHFGMRIEEDIIEH
ncbi:MAG: 3-dehydroquinate synthase II family protein [Thermodesulfobacteriota bacterium]